MERGGQNWGFRGSVGWPLDPGKGRQDWETFILKQHFCQIHNLNELSLAMK